MSGAVRVLYVDDEPGLLEIARLFLEETGEFTVTTATSAQEALASPALLSHDAILADYQMPGMDGIAFLKAVRQLSADIPFILFTGRGREEVVIDAINNGADSYLQKGGDPEAQFAELAHRIHHAVDRRRAEHERTDSEKRLLDIINFLPDATFAIDRSGTVIAWNHAMEEMTGRPAAEMLGKGDFEYAVPFYGTRRPILIDLVFSPQDEAREKYSFVREDKGSLTAETAGATPQGKTCVLWGRAAPLINSEGAITGAIESIRDITGSKTAQERLQRSEERFRSLIQNSSDMIRILDGDGTISYSSPSTLRITGYDPRDLIGKNMLDYVHPLDRERVKHAFGEVCARTNPNIPTEYRIRHADGHYIDVEAIASNQLDIPAIEGIVTTTRPITERKRREEEIAFMNAILSAQQETSLDGILIVDDGGKIINYNRKFPEIWGIPEALLASKIDESVLLHVNEQLAGPEAFLARVRYLYDHREEKSFEELLLKDGRVLERFSAPVSGESGKYYGRIWYFRDITGKKRAELAVARSKKYLDQIFSSVKAGIVIMDARTHEIVDINPAGAAMIGLPKDRILGNTCHRFICPSETGRCPITDLSQDIDNAERTLITGDGRTVPIIKYVVRTNLDGRECLLETFIDNSERRKAEDAVRESEAKYRELADLLPQMVYELDLDLRVTYANRHALAVFGLTGEELRDGVKAFSFIDPSQHGTIKDDMQKFLAGTPFEPREYTAIKKDGSTFSAIIYPGPVYRNKTLSGFRGVIVDISARKKMEEELRAGEEKFRSIFENSPYPIAINSLPDNTFLEVNKAFLAVSGYTETEIIGKDPAGMGLLPLPEIVRLISHRLLKGKIENVPLALTAKGGKRIHVLFSTMPITIGNRPALVTVTAEVTKLKRVEEELLRKNEDLDAAYEDLSATHEEVRQNYEELARKEEVLRESEEKFRALVELSLDGILITDFSGTILFLNRAAARIVDVEDYGAAAGKRNVMEFVAPESQAAVLDDFANVARGHDTYLVSYQLITESKREIWVESIGKKIPFGNTTAVLISLRDVTGRKLAEVAVQESEKKFATVFRSSPVALTLVSTADGKFVDVNDTFTGQTGYSRAEVIGRTSEELGLFADRDEYGRFVSTLRDKQAVDGMELTCRMKSTGIRTCQFSSRIIVMNGRPHILSSVENVTERRRAEEALRQAGKKLNLLSGITRHDIKNQLLTLDGFVALLHKKIPDPSYNEYFSRITKVSSQIASLIQFTREYEMIGVHAPAWLDIRTLVDDAGKNVAFGPVVLDNDLPAGVEIFADPLIAKVFFNLIDNALRHGGKITKIRFSLEERDGDRIIVCADDGGGVSADEKERIFDPGFGKNTGFGLSISREILDITGITITENGEPGKGARFEITVPGEHGGLPVKKSSG
jgi:PAS domain S-box-containing protein